MELTTIAIGATGDVPGPVSVGAGETVKITNARVAGAVTVEPGGTLEVTASALQAGVVAEIPASLRLCTSQVSAPAGGPALAVSGAVGKVQVGEPSAGCGPNRFGGDVRIDTVPDLAMAFNLVAGSLTVEGNGPARVLVSGNVVDEALACSANDPAPTNGGTPNRASSKSGQCTTV